MVEIPSSASFRGEETYTSAGKFRQQHDLQNHVKEHIEGQNRGTIGMEGDRGATG